MMVALAIIAGNLIGVAIGKVLYIALSISGDRRQSPMVWSYACEPLELEGEVMIIHDSDAAKVILQKLNQAIYGDSQRVRTWKERLFTRPWRPCKRKEEASGTARPAMGLENFLQERDTPKR